MEFREPEGAEEMKEGSREYDTTVREPKLSSHPTYAQVMLTQKPSSREFAIVLQTITGIKQKHYVDKIADLVEPQTIKFASRISNNRFCIHLSNKEQVDQLLMKHKEVTIDGHIVPIRRLINPAKRIIISNACPSIPNYIIETELKKMGITLLSPMSFIRAGYQNPKTSNALSFRRQIYIHPDDIKLLKPSIVIQNEDLSHRLFLSEDILICYVCRKQGHFAANCPESDSTEDEPCIQNQQSVSSEEQRVVEKPENQVLNTVPPNSNISSKEKTENKHDCECMEEINSTKNNTTKEIRISSAQTVKKPNSPKCISTTSALANGSVGITKIQTNVTGLNIANDEGTSKRQEGTTRPNNTNAATNKNPDKVTMTHVPDSERPIHDLDQTQQQSNKTKTTLTKAKIIPSKNHVTTKNQQDPQTRDTLPTSGKKGKDNPNSKPKKTKVSSESILDDPIRNMITKNKRTYH